MRSVLFAGEEDSRRQKCDERTWLALESGDRDCDLNLILAYCATHFPRRASRALQRR